MMYYVYILKSIKDGEHYVGMTSNVERRLKYHNKGKVRSTKSRIPFIMIYTETFGTRFAAREREKLLKSYRGSGEKRDIIKNCGII